MRDDCHLPVRRAFENQVFAGLSGSMADKDVTQPPAPGYRPLGNFRTRAKLLIYFNIIFISFNLT